MNLPKWLEWVLTYKKLLFTLLFPIILSPILIVYPTSVSRRTCTRMGEVIWWKLFGKYLPYCAMLTGGEGSVHALLDGRLLDNRVHLHLRHSYAAASDGTSDGYCCLQGGLWCVYARECFISLKASLLVRWIGCVLLLLLLLWLW